ncbi:MAG: M20/M25/M40 family metallo-hydrolase [Candidatus Acidiferrales bacterium]
MKLLRISCIFLLMTSLSVRATDSSSSIEPLAQDQRVAHALDWFESSSGWITLQQIQLTEIPSPPFGESRRGELLRKLFESAGLTAHVDSAGNVIGERPGSGASAKDVVLLAAHLDTVFPAGTDVHVKRSGTRLQAPGIADNGAGLAAIVAVARALSESKLNTGMTLLFAADTGEEGEGNLRGIRKLVETYRSQLRAVIAVDGASTDYVTRQGLASRRIEVGISGPGGHSWSDFGAPNPITALARGIVRFSAIRLPDPPRSTFNFGVIEGGSSVNSIPNHVAVKVDLRSEDQNELARMEDALRNAIQEGIDQEIAATRDGDPSLHSEFHLLGERPGGKLADDSALLAAIRNVDRYLGNRVRFESSSTDANIPLSLGIPAIGIGGGGRGGGSHSLSEWYDPAERSFGLKRILLTALAVAGVQP